MNSNYGHNKMEMPELSENLVAQTEASEETKRAAFYGTQPHNLS